MAKNCAVSAGIVAAIAKPPGMPVANERLELCIVRSEITFLAILFKICLSILACPEPFSISSASSSGDKSSKNSSLKTLFDPLSHLVTLQHLKVRLRVR